MTFKSSQYLGLALWVTAVFVTATSMAQETQPLTATNVQYARSFNGGALSIGIPGGHHASYFAPTFVPYVDELREDDHACDIDCVADDSSCSSSTCGSPACMTDCGKNRCAATGVACGSYSRTKCAFTFTENPDDHGLCCDSGCSDCTEVGSTENCCSAECCAKQCCDNKCPGSPCCEVGCPCCPGETVLAALQLTTCDGNGCLVAESSEIAWIATDWQQTVCEKTECRNLECLNKNCEKSCEAIECQGPECTGQQYEQQEWQSENCSGNESEGPCCNELGYVDQMSALLQSALEGKEIGSPEARQTIRELMQMMGERIQLEASLEISMMQDSHMREVARLQSRLARAEMQLQAQSDISHVLNPVYSTQRELAGCAAEVQQLLAELRMLHSGNGAAGGQSPRPEAEMYGQIRWREDFRLPGTISAHPHSNTQMSSLPRNQPATRLPAVRTLDDQTRLRNVYQLTSQIEQLQQQVEAEIGLLERVDDSTHVAPAQHLQPLYPQRQLVPIDSGDNQTYRGR